MATTYVSGLISGIDTASIVSQLMAIERQPLLAIQSDIRYAEQRKDVYQELNTALLALKDAVAKLDTSAEFGILKATSSDPDLLSVSASSPAAAGMYPVTVVHALSQGLDASNQFADLADKPGRGRLEIYVGGVRVDQININPNDTYQDVLDDINATGLGLNAYAVTDAGGTRIMVQATGPGTANDIELVSSSPGLTFSTVIQGHDAEVQIGGTSFYSTTNTFTGLFPGITMTVNAEPAAPTLVNITVERDTEAVVGNVEDVINKYNEVVKLVNKYNTYDEDDNTGGLLFGDIAVRLMMQDLNSIVTSIVGAVPGQYNSLMAIGVTIDREGLLALDKNVLENAVSSGLSDVITLFTDATEGIATRLGERLGFITAYGDGVIYTQQSALDERISYLERRADDMEEMLADREEMYRRQFQAMEDALAMLQSQSLFLSQQLGSTSGLYGLLGA